MIYNYTGMSNDKRQAINFRSYIDSAVDKKIQQSQPDEDIERLIIAIIKSIYGNNK